MKSPLEKDIQATCLEWLALWGALPIRCNSGAVKIGNRYVRFNNASGCSDCLCCLPDGQFVAIEFKREGNQPTEKQVEFMAKVRTAGGLALVVDSLDNLMQQLQTAGYDTTRRT